MTSRDVTCTISHPGRTLPSERDLDRLTSTLRSVAEERDFPRRVIDRYQEWIYLFVGWSLKVPPGTVSRSRIGDFWTALNEHPGAGTARICEAMDALGFFFGGVLRETEVSPFTDADMAEKEAPTETAAVGAADDAYIPLNPRLQAPDHAARASGDTPSDQSLGRHLPAGALPEEPDARATVPTRPAPRNEGRNRSERESMQTRQASLENSSEKADDSRSARGERSDRDAPTTLFNPEGITPPSNRAQDQTDRSTTEKDTAVERDDSTAGSRSNRDDPRAQPEDTVPSPSDVDPAPTADPDRRKETPQKDEGGGPDSENVPVEIPRPVADRLRRMAHRLGLPPSVCAARAIEMVCEDAGVERSEAPSIEAPLKHYQAQLDMLRLQKEEIDVPVSESAPENTSITDTTSREQCQPV